MTSPDFDYHPAQAKPAPPSTTTRLSIDGVTFDTGDIEIAPGVGISWTRTPGNPTVYTPAASIADATGPSALFVPGALAAVDPFAIFSQLNAQGASFLTELELNLGVAPTGASGVNNLGVKVYGEGAGSGALLLPIDGTGDNGGKHYALDGRVGSRLGAQSAVNGGPNGSATLGLFRVSANSTVGAVAFGWGVTGPTEDGSGIPKVYEIYDAALNLIATSAEYDGPVDTPHTGSGFTPPFLYPVPLKAAVNLLANTNYYAGVRMLAPYANAIGSRLLIDIANGNIPAYSGNEIAAPGVGGIFVWSQNAPGVAGSQWTPALQAAAPIKKTTPIAIALFGGARTAKILGRARVAIVQTGAGPATPGNDMNVRLGWQVAA